MITIHYSVKRKCWTDKECINNVLFFAFYMYMWRHPTSDPLFYRACLLHTTFEQYWAGNDNKHSNKLKWSVTVSLYYLYQALIYKSIYFVDAGITLVLKHTKKEITKTLISQLTLENKYAFSFLNTKHFLFLYYCRGMGNMAAIINKILQSTH